MKLFIKKIDGCSSCPNLYIKYGSWGHRSGYCGMPILNLEPCGVKANRINI